MHKKTGGILLILTLTTTPTHAIDINGRISVLGSVADAEKGDPAHADQQTLRLMHEGVSGQNEWTVHLKATRQHRQNTVATGLHSSDYFRFRELAGSWLDDSDADSSTTMGYELDRAVYKRRFDKFTLSAGRQPIDWGTGRLWQPLNVFGAFAPVDLDTEYKPGIDAVVMDWYPSAFSTMTAAYVFSPDDNERITDAKDSVAVHYRRLVGEQAELALVAGQVNDNQVLGASFESEFKGIGLRAEASHYDLADGDSGIFAIAGADYKFENGTTLAAELYNNGLGAGSTSELAATQSSPLVIQGLQPHLSKQVLGLTAQREISPLWSGGYTLLTSRLDDAGGDKEYSFLHQLNLKYSLGNESELLFSLLQGSGEGLDEQDNIQSEFGHIPASFTVRWSYYF